MLPIGIALVPYAIEWLLPNRRGAIEIAAVTLPIAAFFARIVAGRRHITANNCSARFRQFQFVVFGFAVFMLVFFDAVLMLSHIMPPGAPGASWTELIVLGTIAMTYLALMAIAMYPGREKPLPEMLSLK